jgi:hypothetical protein
MVALPFDGSFLDLTHPSDVEFVIHKLQKQDKVKSTDH